MTSTLTGTPNDSATLVSVLRHRASAQADQVAYRFLLDGENDAATLTYAQVDTAARLVAQRLSDAPPQQGRVLILLPPGLDYVAALFGCWYAGKVAVPAQLPYQPTDVVAQRLATLLRDAPLESVISTSAGLAALQDHAPGSSVRLLSVCADGVSDLTASWSPDRVSSAEPAPSEPGSTALVQYTSGSTRSPRGVVLTHGNLYHNSEQIYRFFGHDTDSSVVSWLPPSHDMGLIGCILQPMFGGFPITLMSPVHFLQRPMRWLEAISTYGATTSGGPNFGFELCTRKVVREEADRLELSRWRIAFNGAEPIRSSTLERFSAAFESSGFRAESFHPCYGLAEATLMVTGGVPWRRTASGANADESSRPPDEPVSCGRPAGDQEVLIVDPESEHIVEPGAIGEIWVAGPSIARSYLNARELTEHTLGARLADGRGPYLRTGDLGWMRNGELYVRGRLDDVITVRGTNHYPQDLEWSAEASHRALRPGCGAVFATADSIVAVWEVAAGAAPASPSTVARSIREAVARDHGVRLTHVVLVEPGRVPRTSSGKISRSSCARLYAAGALSGEVVPTAAGTGDTPIVSVPARGALIALDPVQRRAVLTDYLRNRIAATCDLATAEIDLTQSLFAQGADSLDAVSLAHAISEDLDVDVRAADLAGTASIDRLIDSLEQHLSAPRDLQPDEDQDADRVNGDSDRAALSAEQRSLWWLHQIDPASVEHNVAVAIRIQGSLDLARLRRAVGVLVARHEALRTVFACDDGEAYAVVHPTERSSVAEHRNLDQTQLDRLVNEAADRPFDLAAGPLFRVEVFCGDHQGRSVLLLAAHHAIVDFWSLIVLMSELDTLLTDSCCAGCSGCSGERAALSIPDPAYRDVVEHQRLASRGAEGERHRRYWSEQLHDATAELRLGFHRGHAGALAGSVGWRVDANLVRRLRATARDVGVTVSTVLLSAYALLLHRYSGQSDLLIGVPMAGRGAPQFSRVVGCCSKTVPVRSQLSGDESVRDLLRRTSRCIQGALAHQDVIPHLPGGEAATYRALFVFNRSPAADLESASELATGHSGPVSPFAGVTAEPFELTPRAAPADLHLSFTDVGGALLGTLRHRGTVVDDSGARQLMHHLQCLVEAMVADPGQPASSLPMLDRTEHDQILARLSARSGPQPAPSLLEAFGRHVAEHPDLIAVDGGALQLTYRELDERSNQLSRALAEQGIAEGARIGICLDRSPDLIVTLVGALKVGATYVPADPAHPVGRTRTLFAQAAVSLVVSQRGLSDRVPSGVSSLLVDTGWSDRHPTTDLGVTASGGTPAYVLYTSGSTGAPKGVIISRDSLTSYINFTASRWAMSPGDRVLQFASVTFDASAQQIFAALVGGATLVLRTDWMLSSVSTFLRRCAELSITVLDLPTAYWHELAAAVGPGTVELPQTVRLVIIGGERAVPELVRRWNRRVGSRAQLINNYGPTEATIVALSARVESSSADDEVSIGTPVAGMSAYVLDADRQLVPAGVVGELYLGGFQVAYGYLGAPGLTAQAFVPDQFHPGARMYRTGDLASFDIDGTVRYRGRRDRQLKVRSVRIEPAEIERALCEVPGISNAHVVQDPATGRLIGYLVPSPQTEPPPDAAVREQLRNTLPRYMVPADLVTVPALPLTSNGKVDHHALPAPSASSLDAPTGPVSPLEQALTRLLAEVLKIPTEQVSADDDFFDRGGHSLLATRVVARVREEFGLEIPLRVFFDHPTARALAGQLERMRTEPHGAVASAIERTRDDKPFPLSFAQERLWFLQQLDPTSTSYNVPRALRLRGALDVGAVTGAMADLERRHEILRTTFPDLDGEPEQRIHAPRGIKIALVERAGLTAAAQRRVISEIIAVAGSHQFDLATGPLIRVTLLRLGPHDHVLIVVEHHLLHDGWSQGVFLREFLACYRSRRAGTTAELPPLPIRYVDFAAWQRSTISGDRLRALDAFWLRQIAGAPDVLTLDVARPRPAVLGSRGGQISVDLDSDLERRLRGLANSSGTTLFMVMFAAFVVLLSRHSRARDMVLGTGIANRERPELENLLGMIINTVMLRVDFTDIATFEQLLRRVREVCLDAYAHQDMPFEHLVQALRPRRDLSRMPLFQVMFSFLDTPSPALTLPGVEIEVIDAHNASAKFDLNVIVVPDAQHRLHDEGTRRTSQPITVLCEYNQDLFDPAMVIGLLEQYQQVLNSIGSNPTQSLERLWERTSGRFSRPLEP